MELVHEVAPDEFQVLLAETVDDEAVLKVAHGAEVLKVRDGVVLLVVAFLQFLLTKLIRLEVVRSRPPRGDRIHTVLKKRLASSALQKPGPKPLLHNVLLAQRFQVVQRFVQDLLHLFGDGPLGDVREGFADDTDQEVQQDEETEDDETPEELLFVVFFWFGWVFNKLKS